MRLAWGVAFAALALALPAVADGGVRKVLVAGNFAMPVQVDAPRGTRGIFVVEQGGRVIRLRGGSRSVFLDIRDLVGSGGERGLLSIAFHPRYGDNGRFFVYYTNRSGHSVVARYRANSRRTRARESTRKRVLFVRQPFSNHNGGTLRFGPDRKLYLGLGDGGGACDPDENAQDPGTKLGKLLRKDSKGWRIVGLGLRNPWRMSFDRATGDLYIGDVGQDDREEIDYLPVARLPLPAENYQWDVREGSIRSGCEHAGWGPGERVAPVHDYGRDQGFTVIGGFVYRGSDMTRQRGRYFFGDLGGSVWRADRRTLANRRQVASVSQLVSFGENRKGELFAVSHSGSIYKLVQR